MNTIKRRRDWASVNLNLGIVGLLGIAMLVIAAFHPLPRSLVIAATVCLVVSLPVMFFTRKTDEYTLSLWSTATNAAFATIIAWLVAAPGIEGFIDGLFGIENGQDFPERGAAAASLFAFFVVFNIKRLTGAF
ncbi:hypothetical protein [Aurantiacibacter luteus]|uniref:Uncharacterized protein n=1 Tax=Aurantiacibacter luteus TaxID=1581420 RepID=A0A0G9N1T9_9SPHN|nr:hypothetical protein [Aurantiacibacter luteus]KLE35508.1 hypothetical protein AAW00_03525 [Aurantiacibacter luteus]